MKRLALIFTLCVLVPFILFGQDLPDVKVESKKPFFQPTQAQQGVESRSNAVILMPEINMITHLKSMDFDLRLDSMMRAYNYKIVEREGTPPKHVSYIAGKDQFVAGYNENKEILTLFFVLSDYEQFSLIKDQVIKNFKFTGKMNAGGFQSDVYSMGSGLGTISIGFSKYNLFAVIRELPIPNYNWNIKDYQ